MDTRATDDVIKQLRKKLIIADCNVKIESVMKIVSNCFRYTYSIVNMSLLASGNYAIIRIEDDNIKTSFIKMP